MFCFLLVEPNRLRFVLRANGGCVILHGILTQRDTLLDERHDLCIDLFDLPAEIVENCYMDEKAGPSLPKMDGMQPFFIVSGSNCAAVRIWQVYAILPRIRFRHQR